jgi:hypothetical protein
MIGAVADTAGWVEAQAAAHKNATALAQARSERRRGHAVEFRRCFLTGEILFIFNSSQENRVF